MSDEGDTQTNHEEPESRTKEDGSKSDISPRKSKKLSSPRSTSSTSRPASYHRSAGVSLNASKKNKNTKHESEEDDESNIKNSEEDVSYSESQGKNEKLLTNRSSSFKPRISSVKESSSKKDKVQELEELVASLKVENAALREQIAIRDAKITQLQYETSLKGSSSEFSSGQLPHPNTAKDPRSSITVERISNKDVVGENKAVERKIQKIQREGLIDFDLQTLVRTKQPALLRKQDQNHRERILTEILTTEQSYLLGLEILVKVYMVPLQQLAKRENKFSEAEVATIFGNVESLLYINTQICDELENRLDNWDNETSKVGDLFCDWAPKLKPYCRFGSFYEESLQMIESKKESTAFKKALDELDLVVWNFNQLNLRNYFITPVQRIPRYCLLLRDLQKSTPETHPDYKPLSNAIVKMEEMAQSLNEQIRKAEIEVNLFKILERGGGFDKLLKNPKPLNRIIRAWKKDGEVNGIICINDLKRGKNKQSELLLFNDILVASNFVSKRAPCQDYYQPLHLLWLSLNARDEVKKNVENASLFENAMVVRGPEGEWLIGFQSSAEREQWSQLIIDLIPNIRKPPTKELLEKGHREGIFEFKTKGTYEGNWENGYPHGVGKLTKQIINTDTSISTWVFEGHWDYKLRSGYGTVTKPNKEVVETGWKDENTQISMKDPDLWAPNSELTDRDWLLMLTGAQVVKMKPNERFIEQGKPSTKLYKVKSGKLRVEKGLDPDVPKKVLAILETNAVVGDTSVISFFSMATADVYAHTEAELDMISIDILFGLFRSDPVLSMKFYRQMARKLATALRGLHHKKKKSSENIKGIEESEDESEDVSQSESRTESSSRSDRERDLAKVVNKKKVPNYPRGLSNSQKMLIQPLNPNEEAIRKFQLPSTEVLIKETDCIYKSVFKQVGKIYIFQEHVCFESSVFGMNQSDIYPLKKIDTITTNKNILRIEIKGKKHHFMQIKDQENFTALLMRLWEQTKKGDLNATITAATKGKISKSASKARPDKEQNKFITLTKNDWNLLLGGAKLISYKDGEPIIEEGKEHQRIYQIAKGRCVIKKKGSNGQQSQLGVMESDEIFGEMTFLEKGQKATASVIADGEDVQIYIIEGYYINMTFVDHPELAGRFYCFIATVLAKRLNDREKQIQQEEKKVERKKKNSKRRVTKEKEIKSEPEIENIT